jgi:putative addiction module killer protein
MPVKKTDVFKKWMKKLNDAIAKAHINRRIDRLERGNPGDFKTIGEGCSEMRIDYGPGYRVYYKLSAGQQDTGREIIIILCAGDKSTQQEDIDKAKRLAREAEEEDDENQ